MALSPRAPKYSQLESSPRLAIVLPIHRTFAPRGSVSPTTAHDMGVPARGVKRSQPRLRGDIRGIWLVLPRRFPGRIFWEAKVS